ncbi:hypothetical protein [Aquabacterium commune]|jgi:hypothetical protein|nr:hypothetical protein [Aquabacterium commune]
MELTIKTEAGPVTMRVTQPEGLTQNDENPTEYVVKFIPHQAAADLYSSMDVSNPAKVSHLITNMPKGYVVEIPFLDTTPGGELVCTNDAHVLRALCSLNISRVPVVLHQASAHLI